MGGGRMGARKNGKVVSYGPELEIPRETISPAHRTALAVRYKLFGVVYHHGPTVSSGHYTSAVLSQASGVWLHVDDDLVSAVGVEEVCVTESAAREGKSGEIGGRERCAYLLFYQRVQ
jgi:ubiquitin carboxyl-terminal hydrolase 10